MEGVVDGGADPRAGEIAEEAEVRRQEEDQHQPEVVVAVDVQDRRHNEQGEAFEVQEHSGRHASKFGRVRSRSLWEARGVELPPPPRSGRPGGTRAPARGARGWRSYSHDGLAETIGTDGPSPTPGDAPVAERRLPDGEAISTIIRLFLLERAVPRADAAAALEPLGLEGAAALGLVAENGREVEPLIRLVPSGELTFASDRRTGREQVMGVAPSSALLGNLTIRRRVDRALDVGTGSGIQAVLAARHADLVIATDVSERALAFTAFNAALNGFDNVELRRGSFFDPVEGERFGLVVSNPPFVVSPDTALTYRDAGLRGDAVTELVAPRGGRARRGGRLRPAARNLGARTRRRLVGAGARLGRGNAAAISSSCATRPTIRSPTRRAGTRRRRRPISPRRSTAGSPTTPSWGSRRSPTAPSRCAAAAAQNWVLAEDAPERIEPSEHHMERLFEAQDFLAGGRDLLYERLVLVDEHQLDQALHLDDGVFGVRRRRSAWSTGSGSRPRSTSTPRTSSRASTASEPCARRSPDTAETLLPEGVTPEALGEAAVPALRRMVQLGFLVPSGH